MLLLSTNFRNSKIFEKESIKFFGLKSKKSTGVEHPAAKITTAIFQEVGKQVLTVQKSSKYIEITESIGSDFMFFSATKTSNY